MTKHLRRGKQEAACARLEPRYKNLRQRAGRRRASWTIERRASQAALIRGWTPWRRSTGPKTDAGKARCAMNALKHGFRSRATVSEFRRVRHAIRLAARNNEILRLYLRARAQAARPQIKYKGWYATSRKPDCPSRRAGAIAVA